MNDNNVNKIPMYEKINLMIKEAQTIQILE